MSSSRAQFDVGIIGGGPGGASMAAYLAQAGVRCVVLEADVFPRPHVGESLVPSSTRVFRELRFLEKMEAAKFPRKYGAAWTAGVAKELIYRHDFKGLAPDSRAEISFNERRQPGVDQDYTYHVDRGKFDTLLLEHAGGLGAEVRQGVRVESVDFASAHPRIKCVSGGRKEEVSVRIVVDASGRRTLLGNQLRLKVMDPVFNQYAIHSWFEGYDRSAAVKGTGISDYIYIHFLPISNSWVWQIPIDEAITSIGVVTQKKSLPPSREGRAAFFWEAVGSRREILDNLRKSRQLRPLKEEGDYSYAMTQITGDRFLLIGDAARFVDPIFSTGVSIALNSARFASRDIISALAADQVGPGSFRRYDETIRRGTRNWFEFISVYYRLNVLFTYFINDEKHRLDVLKLLQGDVYDEDEPAVLQAMRSQVAEVERDESHPWHRLLGDLTADVFRPR